MKSKYKYSLLLLMAFTVVGAMLSSCSKEDSGTPLISYIRVTDPAKSDSLLDEAGLGQMIVIMGENLQSTRQVWFNDQEASLLPTLMTSTSIIVRVPSTVPVEVNNQMKLIFANGKSLSYDFTVSIPAPVVASMLNEWAPEGSDAQINGDYFFEPITVKLSDGTVVTTTSVEKTSVTFTVPAGAAEGPITVTTNFGTTISSFHFHDNRNIVLNFDDLTSSGSWRPGLTASDNGLDGNYLVFKGNVTTNQRAEDYPNGSLEAELWSGVNGRPQGNFVNGDPSKLSLKFEANIIDWYGSYLNICFSPYDQNSSNSDVWGYDPGTGTYVGLNSRALWAPWDGGTGLQTDGNTYGDWSAAAEIKNSGWMTVTIPIAKNFIYGPPSAPSTGIAYGTQNFNASVTGSMAFWVIGSPASVASPGSPIEIHIDNVRIVPN